MVADKQKGSNLNNKCDNFIDKHRVEICELMDRFSYNYDRDLILKIKNEAKLLLRSSH